MDQPQPLLGGIGSNIIPQLSSNARKCSNGQAGSITGRLDERDEQTDTGRTGELGRAESGSIVIEPGLLKPEHNPFYEA